MFDPQISEDRACGLDNDYPSDGAVPAVARAFSGPATWTMRSDCPPLDRAFPILAAAPRLAPSMGASIYRLNRVRPTTIRTCGRSPGRCHVAGEGFVSERSLA